MGRMKRLFRDASFTCAHRQMATGVLPSAFRWCRTLFPRVQICIRHPTKKARLTTSFFNMGRMKRLFRDASFTCAHRQMATGVLPSAFRWCRTLFPRVQICIRHPTKKARLTTSFFNMGRMKRFELSTSGTTNQRSNQLSYIRHHGNKSVNTVKKVKSQYQSYKKSIKIFHQKYFLILTICFLLEGIVKIIY